MENKKTKKEKYAEIITLLDKEKNADLIEMCEQEIERLEQKILNKKPTKTQLDNEEYKEILMENFEENPNQYFTIQELIDRNPAFVAIKMSNQRMSSLLSALVRAGKVEKKLEKKRAYYKLAVQQEVNE